MGQPSTNLNVLRRSPSSITLLLIDDAETDREIYTRHLRADLDRYYNLLHADCLEEGITLWQLHRPDVVLVDVNLPDGNGLELLEFLQTAATPTFQTKLPVIVLTGQGNERIAVQAMKLGASDYLVKDDITAISLCKSVAAVHEYQALVHQLERSQQQKELLSEIALRIRQSLDLSQILQAAVDGGRQLLGCDRTVIYQFQADWSGCITVESVRATELTLLNREIIDPCLASQWHEAYRQGRTSQVNDRADSALQPCYADLLASIQVRANLVAPILQNDHLWGLLIAHECDRPRDWQPSDLQWIQELATQSSIAIQQAMAYLQLQHLNQDLEDRVAQRTAENQFLRERLQFILASSPAVLYARPVSSDDFTATFVSNNLTQHFGYTPEDFMHRPGFWLSCIHPDDQPQVLAKVPQVLAQGDQRLEYRIRHQNGEYRWIQDEMRLVCAANSCSCELVGYFVDISDRKQFEQQLQQTNVELARATRLKDEFLANMSHELRTPLNAILGMSESLQEEILGPLQEPQKKAIHTIERSGQHLLELINDILDLSKISSGNMELYPAVTPITTLCQSSLIFVKQLAFKKGIQITSTIAADLGSITVDERRIRQVLINLLTNAVKFTPVGGQINLTVTWTPEIPTNEPFWAADHCLPSAWLLFAVRDTGIGIAATDLPRLFQPFVQIDSSLNRQQPGTGLGLAMVKQIVELHNGRVTVESNPGQGSCFTVALPYQRSPQLTPTVPDRVEPPLDLSEPELAIATPRILLAEDNEANISTFTSYLSACNYHVVVARTGAEAIAQARVEQPDLILMDIQMPGMDGLEAMRLIRADQTLASIPIIALTALAMPADQERCLAAGANAYLSKPVRLRQLVETIQQWL